MKQPKFPDEETILGNLIYKPFAIYGKAASVDIGLRGRDVPGTGQNWLCHC